MASPTAVVADGAVDLAMAAAKDSAARRRRYKRSMGGDGGELGPGVGCPGTQGDGGELGAS